MTMQAIGKVPAYTDISHFRAPYKNVMIAGFGQDSQENTMTVTAPPTPAPPNGLTEEQLVVKKNGAKFIRPESRPLVMDTLSVTNAVTLSPTQVQLERFTPEQIQAAQTDPAMKAIIETNNARAWTERQVKAGRVVMMNMSTLIKVISGAGQFDQNDQLGSMEPGEDARAAAAYPHIVILAGEPGGSLMAGLGGPVGVLLAVGVVGGAAYLLMNKKKRGRSRSPSF